MNSFKPDYEKCLVNLSSSILKRFDIEPFHPSIKNIDNLLAHFDNIVVMLFDGLGKSMVERHLPEGAYLRKHYFDTITSVFPPTTVAATTALLSGRYPIETGWLGWYQYYAPLDKMVNSFAKVDSWTLEKIPSNPSFTSVEYETVIDLIKKQNPDMLIDSVWPATVRENGAKTLDDYFERISKFVSEPQKKLLYCYWDEPDHLAHMEGIGAYSVHNAIEKINDGLQALVSKADKKTLFLVIADHSLVDVKWLDIREHKDFYDTLVRPFGIEPRAATFYVKEDKKRQFLEAFYKYYQPYFNLKNRRQIIEDKQFGLGKIHPLCRSFIGDFLAISMDKYAFFYSSDPKEKPSMKAHHAGGTADESLINVYALYNKQNKR